MICLFEPIHGRFPPLSICDSYPDCVGCNYSDPFKQPKQTNADRIRAMSDEELADIIDSDWRAILCNNGVSTCNADCRTKILEWLKQPYNEKGEKTMKEAYQVYDIERDMTMPAPTDETGKNQFKCYCSICGCPVYSDTFPSLREECPHCKAEFSVDRLTTYGRWTAELNHVGYSPRECGREQ